MSWVEVMFLSPASPTDWLVQVNACDGENWHGQDVSLSRNALGYTVTASVKTFLL
jgi:hypothetical protein